MSNTIIWCLLINHAQELDGKPFPVEVSSTDTVGDLKKKVKLKNKHALDDIVADHLVVWKCEDRRVTTTWLKELARLLKDIDFQDEDNALTAGEKVTPDFESQIFFVRKKGGKASSSKKRKHEVLWSFEEERNKDIERVQKIALSASKAAGKELASAQAKAPVLMNIPADKTGPPIQLYHPLFADFEMHMRETDEIPVRTQLLAWRFSEACVTIFKSEADRFGVIKPLLSELLGFTITTVSSPNVKSDGVVTVSVGDPTEHHYNAFLVIIEDKNRLGEGESDPYNQAAFAYQRYWATREQAVLRSVCYCPTIIISMAGPRVCVAGGIYLTRAVVQLLTTGFLWVGPMTCSDVRRRHVERLFTALRKTLGEFSDYYEGLSGLVRGAPKDVQRQVSGFPPITHYNTVGGADTFTYLERLAPCLVTPRSSTTSANWTLLTDEQRKMVRGALNVLHGNHIVFGDLRAPNIIVENEGGRIKLVDFDECGKEDRGTYPFGINMKLTWAEGVGAGNIMRREHDFFMLDQL
ncbi:hypothetical protein EI94DRAFT_1794991 [Lactarius quietus]|nr:hypothetical protein EI94DRAFT_1794991 [Lactarius quietus]